MNVDFFDPALAKSVCRILGSEQIKVIGAVIVSVAALWRFFRTESQKQARNASSLIEKFAKDDKNFAAVRMIDWEEGHFSVKVAGVWKSVPYTSNSYIKALRTTETIEFEDNEQIIRDVMDHFLSDLERINFLIDRKVISKSDFDAYFYYCRGKMVISDLDKDKDQSRRVKALWKYIHKYEFKRFPKLLAKYNMHIPSM
jgi:hypothetical protein